MVIISRGQSLPQDQPLRFPAVGVQISTDMQEGTAAVLFSNRRFPGTDSMVSTLGIALALGVIHLVVDAATVSVVIRASHFRIFTPADAFAVVLAYDVLAFGSQVLLGAFTDRWWQPAPAMRLGLGLTVASVFAAVIHPALAVLLAGFGNALFHLGAGALVLGQGLNQASPVGLFVAPGALGLAFGINYGRAEHWGPLWPLAIVSALAWFATGAIRYKLRTNDRCAPSPGSEISAAGPIALTLFLLLVSVAVRSLVGLSATRGITPSAWLMFGVPFVAFAGKSLGGYAADRYGWIRTSLTALLASCPLLVFGAQHAPLLLVGLLLFQMTMPVTLTAVARLMPRSLATAFGWTCLALIFGALPTMLPRLAPICTRPALFGWILLSAVAVAWGLQRVEPLKTARA